MVSVRRWYGRQRRKHGRDRVGVHADVERQRTTVICVDVAECPTVGWPYQEERGSEKIKVSKKGNAVTYEPTERLNCIA